MISAAKLFSPRALLFGIPAILALAAIVWLLIPSGQAHTSVGLVPAAPRKGQTPIVIPTPQFSFPDQDDQPLTTQALKGKVWIADFIFTHCANTCPRMTAKRIELQQKIKDPRVMFLSFSVDPDRDDRATRKSYAAENKIDESRWKFICPPDHATALKIAQQMKVAALPPPRGQIDPILHTDRFILIDANAQIRGSYPLDDEASLDRLVSDALAYANEAPAH